MSEFYFKWSKFALKRCNLTNTGTENKKRSEKILKQENLPKGFFSTDKDYLVTYRTETCRGKNYEQRIEVENIRSNRTWCLFDLEGRKAD